MSQPLFGLTSGVENALERARQFNVDFLDLHFGGKEDKLSAGLAKLDQAGVAYELNFEGAPIGWTPSDGLITDLSGRRGFLGFMLDEADHMQINAHWPVISYYGYKEKHFFVETEGMDLLTARQAVFAELARRNQACTVGDIPAAVEFLFPVMMHTSAKAGLNLSPKILKETCGPAMLAVAMGAARQYGVDFWIDVDYWWHNETIGHSAERFRSALQLAYWSGASRIYVEGGAAWSNGHPVGAQIERAYTEFLQDYVPTHPRDYDWRTFKPETAIIRYDDTCFDARQSLLGEYPGPLYGHAPAGPENWEWLNLWSLLSHGFVRTDSVSHQWETRRFGSRTLFVPLHNLAVYDHEVDYPTLAGLKLIFVSGVQISPQTLSAVQRCVREGATCVLPPRLAPGGSGLGEVAEITIQPDQAGKWVVVPDFYRLHYEAFAGGPMSAVLREALAGLTGDGDHLVYRFGERMVRFAQGGADYPRHQIMGSFIPLTQAGTNPDFLEVEIS